MVEFHQRAIIHMPTIDDSDKVTRFPSTYGVAAVFECKRAIVSDVKAHDAAA